MDNMQMIDMKLHTNEWVKEIGADIVRVPGGWIYYEWDYQVDDRKTPGTFVTEPKEAEHGEDA